MHIFNTLIARAIPFVPRSVIQKISRRYIAGETLSQALARVRALNESGFSVTLDVLGETVSTLQDAEASAHDYIELLEAVHSQGLNANISIKPSAMGLLLDVRHCEALASHILERAQHLGNSVCMDMEDVTCTTKEIDLFKRLAKTRNNVGLALQAYLNRTYDDIEALVSTAGMLRICKGIYAEHRSHLVSGASRNRTAINEHFLHHVERCFSTDTFVAIATHDDALIRRVIERSEHLGIDKTRFEFQMLLGVCEPLRDRILALGYNVRVYVPFGKDWYGYSTRRLKESPAIAGYVGKALIGR